MIDTIVNISLCLFNYHSLSFTILALIIDGGEWSASCSGHFTTEKVAPWYLLGRRFGGPSGHLDDVHGKKYILKGSDDGV
jgi:hypothetical protein